ncbi:MAG: NAD(P)-binding domain-containing protein [Pseudomonadota bacterium]
MKIAIIGAGRVGVALGERWKAAGHAISFGVRDPKADAYFDLRVEFSDSAISNNRAAARSSDVVLIATPWGKAESAVQSCGDLSGKVVLDATNPVSFDGGEEMLLMGHTTSAGEQVAEWAIGAFVYKTLNQVGVEVMVNPVFGTERAVMMFAGSAADAPKSIVAALLADLEFDAVYIGDISKARLLEPLGMVWIHGALNMGLGRNWAFVRAVKSPDPAQN